MDRYKTIDGQWTPWKAYHRPWYKRFLRKLYVRFVGDAYIPHLDKVSLVRERQKTHPRYGEIRYVVLSGKGYEIDGSYIFHDFGTKFEGHEKQ